MNSFVAISSGLTALCLCSTNLYADVLLHYSFDTDFQDFSGNGNHGVVYDHDSDGDITIEVDAGVHGGGMRQGDKDDRVDLTTAFTPADGTPWTIAFFADLIGGAASYGFDSSNDNFIQVRGDAENVVRIGVGGVKYTFDSSGIITQNSDANHYVIVANPTGVDLDGVAGDDKFTVYANGQQLTPEEGQDLTNASVSTAITVNRLGDSGEWPGGSAGDYDEFWILDHALNAHGAKTLMEKNHPGALWYVNVNTPAAELSQDGESWDTAYDHLQDALATSAEHDMIWVANGTYRPVVPADPANPTVAEQQVSFALKKGQKLYGGFKGNETSTDIPFNPGNVKLSGDIGDDDINGSNGFADLDLGFVGGNSYHVLSVDGADDCVINGFIIVEGGDASVSDIYERTGGGIFVKDSGAITIEDCKFYHNNSRNGSGLYVKNTAVSLLGCEFKGNRATNSGGAIMANHQIDEGNPLVQLVDCLVTENSSDASAGAFSATYANLRFYNSKFISNTAVGSGGAVGIYRTGGNFVNCLFVENSSSVDGGAVQHRSGGTLTYVNNTFYGNLTGGEGHHVYVESSASQKFVNSVLWHGPTVPVSGSAFYKPSGTATYEHCLVQAVDLTGVGTGNLDGTLATNNPEFTDPSDGEYGVRAYSPLVNAGVTNPAISGGYDGPDVDGDGDTGEIYPADLYGSDDLRVVGESIDIGAFEHQDPFEVENLEFGYEDFGAGGPWRRIDLSDALDSEDDTVSVSVTNSSVVDVLVEDEVVQLTINDYGSTEVVMDFQYQGGAVHRFTQVVTVTPDPLESRDLSALVDVDYTSTYFGVTQDYADLSGVFDDGPSSFSVLSSNTDVFTVSQNSGDVDVVPAGFGQADLTLRAHYGDGTVLEVVRSVSIELPAASKAAAETVTAMDYGINGDSTSFTFADLSVALTEGVTNIIVTSSDTGVYTVSESGGIVTVTPVGSGSADITIDLQYSTGEVYTIQKTLRVLDHDGQLLANYQLNGDATDAQGSYDATASAQGVTWSGTDVLVGEEGVITAPDSLTDDLMLIDGSMQLNFSFKVESASEDGVKMLAAVKDGNSSSARAGGLMLSYVEDATNTGQVNLYLNYADGVSSDDYHFKILANCTIGEWYDLKLVFDFDLGVWTLKVGDQYATGPINHKSSYQYDYAAMKEVLRSNPLRLGSFDQKNAEDPLEESEASFDNLLVYSPAQAVYPSVNAALDALAAHATGATPLVEADQVAHFETIEQLLALAPFTKIKESIEAFMLAYEDNNTSLFAADTKVDPKTFDSVTQALIFVQQWMHDTQFTNDNVAQVSSYIYEAHESFPGIVPATEPRISSATVTVDGDYAIDPAALMIWADTVMRPLGYYAPAGELVTISVNPAYTGLGLKVVVGAHFRNLEEDVKTNINRYRDIATEYDLDSPTITVANPFGGGLYIRIPDGTSAGDVDVTVQGAVKSAYFSARSGKETDVVSWLAEVATSEVPWVDFESDKFMFTIPLDMAQAATDPAGVMAKWDEIMDQYRIMNGRPLDNRIRAEYFLVDRMLVTPAWGAGYPMVVPESSAQGASSDWNPMNVLTIEPNRTWFHELGHNCAIVGPVHNPVSRVLADQSVIELGSWAEGESLVNIPAFIIGNKVYGESLDEAFSSATFQPLTIDEAAYDWMITENFRNNRQIGLDTSGVYDISNNNKTDELRYQARGIGRYGDIVRTFGWEGLEKIHSEFYPIRLEDMATPTNKEHRILRDAFIRRSSEAMGVNMAPLLHFWGVKPSAELKAELATMPKSPQIKDMLDRYATLAPTTRAEFDAIIAQLAPNVGDYTIQRHDYYQGYVTDADAQAIGAQIQFILDEYGLSDVDAPTALAVTKRADGQLDLSWNDNALTESGYVLRVRTAGEVIYNELSSTPADTVTALASSMDEGVYTFSVAAVFASGVESLPAEVVFEVTYGYSDWYAEKGLVLGVNAAQSDDPDFDGITNFMEFSFGGNPLSNEGLAVIDLHPAAQNDTMEITFTRAQEGLHYQVLQSSDISNWSVIWDSRVDLASLVDEGEDQTVSVDTSAARSMFYRVKVSE